MVTSAVGWWPTRTNEYAEFWTERQHMRSVKPWLIAIPIANNDIMGNKKRRFYPKSATIRTDVHFEADFNVAIQDLVDVPDGMSIKGFKLAMDVAFEVDTVFLSTQDRQDLLMTGAMPPLADYTMAANKYPVFHVDERRLPVSSLGRVELGHLSLWSMGLVLHLSHKRSAPHRGHPIVSVVVRLNGHPAYAFDLCDLTELNWKKSGLKVPEDDSMLVSFGRDCMRVEGENSAIMMSSIDDGVTLELAFQSHLTPEDWEVEIVNLGENVRVVSEGACFLEYAT
jgi:hypothetical protein